jgi:hypothetical protein
MMAVPVVPKSRYFFQALSVICAVLFCTTLLASCGDDATGPVPAGATSAKRVELPSSDREPPPPISTAQVCEAPSKADLLPQGGSRFATFLRTLTLSSPAHAQFIKELIALVFGDVHITTLGNVHYDFQAVGEFIAFKTKDGSFEIQVRQQPYGTSKTVSVSTAIAMNVSGDIVSVYGSSSTPTYINHRPSELGNSPIPLSHGGRVEKQGNGVVVVWPNRSQVRILYGSYIDYVVTLCSPDREALGGILGRDEQPQGGFVTRKGDPVQLADLDQDAFYQRLYRTFGDSWRVSQNESLFDYAAGQSTKTFSDLEFPYRSGAGAAVSDAQRTEADAICRKAGLTDALVLADCVLDVAATGDAAFADNDAFTHALYIRSQRAEADAGSWECGGPALAPGWECTVHNLTGARIGSSMVLTMETIQSDQKKPESLECGPITDAYEARCRDKMKGIGFQGAEVVEELTLQTGELLRSKSRATCKPAKALGEPC